MPKRDLGTTGQNAGENATLKTLYTPTLLGLIKDVRLPTQRSNMLYISNLCKEKSKNMKWRRRICIIWMKRAFCLVYSIKASDISLDINIKKMVSDNDSRTIIANR